MSGETVLKPDKDFSSEVDKQLPEAESLAKALCLLPKFSNSTNMMFCRVTFKAPLRNLQR
jgi:hypothetical protein